jgi:hypothetical protein
MLDDSAVLADAVEAVRKASAVVALDLTDAGSLDVERLAGPQLAPALAGGVRHDRPRPVIQPGIAGFIPRIDVVQAIITAASLDKERRDHATPLAITAGARSAETVKLGSVQRTPEWAEGIAQMQGQSAFGGRRSVMLPLPSRQNVECYRPAALPT